MNTLRVDHSLCFTRILFAETLLGFLPQLEMGDCTVAQTGTIVRTCAKMANLAGECPEDSAKADMLNECCKDLFDGKILNK